MDTAATTNESFKRVKWMYWDEFYSAWISFMCVDNMITEEAYQANEPRAILDHCYIEFRRMVRISKHNNSECVIKRTAPNVQDLDYIKSSREVNPSYFVASHVNRPGAFGDFIWEAYLLGQWRDIPQEILVEKAAQGIIEEGKNEHRQIEAEWMAKHLLEVKHGTRKQIWHRCVYLYTVESFPYRRLNQILSGSLLEKERRRMLQTLGLFAWFLFDFPQDVDEFEGHVYRGIRGCGHEAISYFKDMAEKGELLTFPTFTSTSRNRLVAEKWGDTIFIISIVRSRETSIDVSTLSHFPEEEEQLLIPGFLFKVTHVEFDDVKDRHLIYLQDCNNQ